VSGGSPIRRRLLVSFMLLAAVSVFLVKEHKAQ
jgi:hypothetical protein